VITPNKFKFKFPHSLAGIGCRKWVGYTRVGDMGEKEGW